MLAEKIGFYISSAGFIVAHNVPESVYMRDYAEEYCEWADGTVIKMSPVHDRHDEITRFLSILLSAYFEEKPIATLRQAPFVMRYQFEVGGEIKQRNREPDLQVILKDNPQTLMPTYMDGAADIAIEVISHESSERDYGTKFHEYEAIGVKEYWIIDPLKKEARFYRLEQEKAYILQSIEGSYTSPLLPKLRIDTALFWQADLLGPAAIVKMVLKMLDS